jgi:hypothetical protein
MAKGKKTTKLRYRSITVRSLADFVDTVQMLQDEWSELEAAQTKVDDGGDAHIWFRGHGDKNWELTPKIFRTGNEITVADEDELYSEFLRRGCSLAPSLSIGWHSYFVMQHHGIPSRLLDWTDSALVALYFALKDCRQDAAVWAMNPLWLNGQTTNRYALVEPNNDPVAAAFMVPEIHAILKGSKGMGAAPLLCIAVRPPWVSTRMVAQRSLFTLHGPDDLPIETYPVVGKDSPICRIVVPVEYRNDVMAGLRACGIAETSVYPDLDGLAKELVTEYGGLDLPKRADRRLPKRKTKTRSGK